MNDVSESQSIPSLDDGQDIISGPLDGQSNPTWRRQRLLRIPGAEPEQSLNGERTPLRPSLRHLRTASYGALTHSVPGSSNASFHSRHRFPASALNDLRFPSAAGSPYDASPLSVRKSSYFSQRPLSAYDEANLVKPSRPSDEPDSDVNSSGIRVWYSSFSSIDWLHDSIKDSVRRLRLRRRKSIQGRIRRQIDRSIGWIIVTIVGILTAVAAFLIVRSEQWLFELKDGYCRNGWWKAKRFCCPPFTEGNGGLLFRPSSAFVFDESCSAWSSWAEFFAYHQDNDSKLRTEGINYASYTCIALIWAITSALLTIYLTASTSFTTRKDSTLLAGLEDNFKDTQPKQKRKVMYYAAGSGIPEIKTILSGFVIHGYLGTRTLFTKAIGLALSVGSGLSLGKEGPLVHIGSCIGNIVSRHFAKYERNEGKRREILSAASAAGVAVAFGAPIGGVLFSLEEVSYFFPSKVMWRSFFCAMIAAITLRALDPFRTGKIVLFQVTYDKDWHGFELFFFLILGVFGGVYGAYFSKLNYRWSKYVRNGTWLKDHPVIEVILITMVTTVLCFINPYTHMGGTALVYNLFAECREGSPNTHSSLCVLNPSEQAIPVIYSLLTALVVKSALTVVTFGIKVPAGIFIPTLGVGACAGRILGICVQWMQMTHPTNRAFDSCGGDLDCVIPGLYAMVGAAAALSGVTRTTVSLAVIMFELTDTLTYAVPVMLSILVAKTVADFLEPKGIYDLVIELSQLPYLNAKHDYLWGDCMVIDVTDRESDVIRVDHQNTVKTLRDQLLGLVTNDDDGGFPILRQDDNGSRMVGYIGASELEHALSIVADEVDSPVFFHVVSPFSHGNYGTTTTSVSSLVLSGEPGDIDPYDFSVYMDKAPLTVQTNSPLQLVQELFVKLGARYVIVTDTDGYYEGIIVKKAWLAFLRSLENRR